jgi:hypothetical protein
MYGLAYLTQGNRLCAVAAQSASPSVDPPAGVARENGHEKGMLTRFEGDEPATPPKKLGFANQDD